MRQHLNKGLKVGIFFAVGILILYLVYQRQDVAYQSECAIKGIPASDCSLMAKVAEDIGNANYFWVLITMLLFMSTNVLRALRWKMMFQAIGYKPKFINLFGTIMINYLANLGIPRSGEIIRAGLIADYEQIPVEKALGTIFTDRVFDVIMLAIVILITILIGGSDFIAYLNQNVNFQDKLQWLINSPMFSVIFIGIAGLITFLAYSYKDNIKNSAAGKKIIALLSGFAEGVQSVKSVSSPFLFIIYTVGIWIIYYLMLYFAFFTFAPTSHLGPIAGLVVFVFGSLGILIPTPGGMGSYHYLVGEALAMYGINGSDAFSFANIVFFSIQIFVNILFGAIALIALPVINKIRP